MTYYEQVANWIRENTKGATLGQGAAATTTQQPGRDPWGSDNRYRPGDAGSSSVSGQRKLPQRTYLDIIEGNPTNAINIILQKSEELGNSGTLSPTQMLQSSELDALKALSTQLQNKQDPHPTEMQTNTLLKIASSWPTKSKVPAVGILALLAVSPAFVIATSRGKGTVVETIDEAGLLKPRQETANNVVHAIRLLANLFKTKEGLMLVDGLYEGTLHLVRPFAQQPESPAQLRALATLYLNYAVLLTSQAPSTEATRREARAKELLIDIAGLLEVEGPHVPDNETVFRSLAALGTLLTLGADFRAALKEGLPGTLLGVERSPAAQSQNVKDIIAEIRDELR